MLELRKFYNKSDFNTDVFVSLFLVFICSFAMGSLAINNNDSSLKMSSHYLLIFNINFIILLVSTFRIWSKLSRFFTMKEKQKMKGLMSFIADKDGNYNEGTFKVEILFLFCIINISSYHLGVTNELIGLNFIELFVFCLFILTVLCYVRISNVFNKNFN